MAEKTLWTPVTVDADEDGRPVRVTLPDGTGFAVTEAAATRGGAWPVAVWHVVDDAGEAWTVEHDSRTWGWRVTEAAAGPALTPTQWAGLGVGMDGEPLDDQDQDEELDPEAADDARREAEGNDYGDEDDTGTPIGAEELEGIPAPVTAREAAETNPYRLAAVWSDRSRWPLPLPEVEPQRAAELAELAVMAVVADRMTGWQASHIARAIRGGASVHQVAAALWEHPHSPWHDPGEEGSLAEVARIWHRWVAGQRDLHARLAAEGTTVPPSFSEAQYQQVRDVLGEWLYCDQWDKAPGHRSFCRRCGQVRDEHNGLAEGQL